MNGTRHGLDRGLQDALGYRGRRVVVEEWRHGHIDGAGDGAEANLGGGLRAHSALGDYGDIDQTGHGLNRKEVIEFESSGYAVGHFVDDG